jgi:sec-independent protein translocase protein TatA
MPALTTIGLIGSLGAGEMLLIFVVVLVLFGSKNVPRIARSMGKAMEEFRRAAREVSGEILRSDMEPPARKPAPPPPQATLPTPPPDAGKDGDASSG